MMTRRSAAGFATVFFAGIVVGQLAPRASAAAQAPGGNRVFEIRTYTAPDGKLEELHARFRNHTVRIFNNQNITSRAEAEKNWAAFQADPEWQKVNTESQVNGRIVSKVERIFADPADYSPLK